MIDLKQKLSATISLSIELPIDMQFNRNGDGTILFQDDDKDDTEFYIYIVADPAHVRKDWTNAGYIPYHGIRITKFENIESMLRRIRDEIEGFKRNLNDLAR